MSLTLDEILKARGEANPDEKQKNDLQMRKLKAETERAEARAEYEKKRLRCEEERGSQQAFYIFAGILSIVQIVAYIIAILVIL